jgi:hypothetical protein
MIMENKEEPLVNPVLDDATLALFEGHAKKTQAILEEKANEFLDAQEAWMDAQMKELMPESLYLRRHDPEAEIVINEWLRGEGLAIRLKVMGAELMKDGKVISSFQIEIKA